MLDAFYIFTKGGIVLWSFSLAALKGNPVDALIRSCLLEERTGDSSYAYTTEHTAYTLKWSFHNELELVFVAVFQRVLQLAYVDDLLAAVNKQFSQGHYRPSLRTYPEFEDEFRRLLAESERKSESARKPRQIANFDASKKTNAKDKGGKTADDDADGPEGRGDASATLGSAGGSASDLADSADASPGAFDLSKLKGKSKKGTSSAATAPAVSGKAPVDDGKKKKARNPRLGQAVLDRKDRVWGGGTSGAKLDFSDKPPVAGGGGAGAGGDDGAVAVGRSAMDMDDESSTSEEEEDEGNEGGGAGGKASQSGASQKGWFNSVLKSSVVTSVVGKASLELDDVAPILEQLKMNLLKKNVASEIADKLAESVANGLVGRRQASFTSLSATVKASMEEALKRILTPKRSTDILREAQAARDRGRPYTVVFVGVNGVGKSTNLAKVAYWLQQHEMKVMIAACDTFRAGAVEQLRTHCTRLNISLFERGYEKDPSAVAAEAIKLAQKSGSDVVLVDTAGRMQDNEPLMRALSKLINVNKPDLVLFVGEALVGNDAVDQLSKFNERLADLAADPTTRNLIDGIVLTKFDTIDDKVGAALSMVYQSGAPIMFVGCGQTYTDLRRFNVASIVKSLLR